jgi:hypothetical protein
MLGPKRIILVLQRVDSEGGLWATKSPSVDEIAPLLTL